MTTARQLFCRAANEPFHDDSRVREAVESFKAAAALWREAGNYFFAGYAMSNAISASWGSEYDGKDLEGLLSTELQDFGRCVETGPPHSHESLSALCVWLEDLRKMIPLNLVGGSHLKRAMRDLGAELAQRLMSLGADSPNAEYYLVRGHTVATDLAGKWEAWFPSGKGRGLEAWDPEAWGNVLVTFGIPSAFGLFISGGDYRGAAAVIERCPQAFTTPELRGWKAAVRGFLNPEEALERFREAAAAFAEDTRPSREELMQRDGPWSSFNVEVQSRYFLAKAALAMAAREPERLKEHLLEAAGYCDAIDSFWFDGGIIRFRILIQTLARLINDESPLTAEQAREQFLMAVMISGEDPDDVLTLHFW